jgi:hypothetical protein
VQNASALHPAPRNKFKTPRKSHRNVIRGNETHRLSPEVKLATLNLVDLRDQRLKRTDQTLSKKGALMSEIKLNLVDAERVLHGTIHGSIADRCVAALSAEPETIGEGR